MQGMLPDLSQRVAPPERTSRMIHPDDIIAQIELPSSNKAEWIHQFMDEVNRGLAPGKTAKVEVDWRSNRRFLTILKAGGK
ncbi:MAG: hypothetical protein NTZ05_21825 [Chloroflexi bacterium]|nr:hypothetical protein [Chloroflexota bacterium]